MKLFKDTAMELLKNGLECFLLILSTSFPLRLIFAPSLVPGERKDERPCDRGRNFFSTLHVRLNAFYTRLGAFLKSLMTVP